MNLNFTPFLTKKKTISSKSSHNNFMRKKIAGRKGQFCVFFHPTSISATRSPFKQKWCKWWDVLEEKIQTTNVLRMVLLFISFFLPNKKQKTIQSSKSKTENYWSSDLKNRKLLKFRPQKQKTIQVQTSKLFFIFFLSYFF